MLARWQRGVVAALPAVGVLAAAVVVVASPADGPTTSVSADRTSGVAVAVPLQDASVAAGVAGDGAPHAAPDWVVRVAAATGIPSRALQAYADAQLAVARADPGCGLGWTTVAAIGAVESDHGRHDGARIDPDGVVRPTVLGPPLDGTAGNLAVPDTDGGALDGDRTWDRAVGPLQFVPTTWREFGRSATGGPPDPNRIDDAALTAAFYLCAGGGDLAVTADWRRAIGTYNAPPEYADLVAATANRYAAASGG